MGGFFSMIGKTLSHYRVVEKIGAGGMGEVYRARDEHLGRDVALKVLPAGTLGDEHARKRFRKEALALSKLNHPHIATVFDFDTQDGTDFLVMELVEGVTLSDKLAGGPLPEKEITRLGMQLAEALEEAHEQGVVHRDLKPGNVMVTPKGQAKILDFGLAKLVQPVTGTATTESFTETQAAAGTLPYMAPEQVRGETVDARTDLYALGAVLYEMATGQRAFAETQAGRLMDAILHTAPVAPTRFQPRLSGELERIILKCLEKEPEDRYQSAKEVEVDLRRLKRDTDSGRATVVSAAATRAKKRWKMLVPVAALLAVLAAATVWQFRPAQALTESDFILLTDFVNKTGDEIFDGTLKQALAVKLQESPFLNVFPERRVRQTLARMQRAPDQRLTPALGEEICQREGIKAMLTGEIAPLGSHYVITLNVVNSRTGDSLAREQVEANSKENVLTTLGEATSKLRAKLGESLSSIEAFDTPLAQATTSSLEALKVYTLGLDQEGKGARAESISFYKRALELDPNFALAYSRLGTIYGNLGETDIASEYKKKAFELRGRVSETERFYISSHYYFTATGELERAIEIYNLWMQAYPRHSTPHNNLAVTYELLGQYEKAVEEAREALRLAPDSFYPYVNLGIHLSALNRFDEARKVFEESIARNLDVVETHTALYLIAFFQGDAATMQEEVERAAGKPDEYRMRQLQATTVATTGKLRESRELSRQAVELAQRHNFSESAARIAAAAALMEANHGNSRQAREKAAEALSIARSRDAKATAAIALARAGAVKQAQALIDELEKRYPKDTLVNLIWAPTARAAVELQRGNAEKAIEVLRPAAPYERAYLETIYGRGRAYLLAGVGAKAAAEFQKILDLKGVWYWSISLSRPHALAQLGLARAYALAGEAAQSRRAYEDFFSLWKDADPDIPILQEAKAEYAQLR